MKPGLDKWFRAVASDEPGPFWVKGSRTISRAASWLYGLGAAMHHAGYDLGLHRVKRLPAPVIGVGGISVGGAGKTPLVIALVEALQRMGLKAGVISRGYGGSAGPGPLLASKGQGALMDARQCGDEPALLAKRLRAPVAVAAERYEAGKLLLERLGPMVLVADDLFQHRRLHRDLNLAALDAANPLGNRALLPRGGLREPPRALRRAHAIVLTRADDGRARQKTRAWLKSFWGNGPVLACRHRLAGMSLADGSPLEPGDYNSRPVLAFCGLARPAGFAKGLEGLGLEVMKLAAYPDHHRFSGRELGRLWGQAKAMGAKALVCSEKDLVRLPQGFAADARIWVTRLELEFVEGTRQLEQLLGWGLAGWRPAR